MAKIVELHPDNPQSRGIVTVTNALRDGALMAYPTDSGYALGAALGNSEAKARIQAIRDLDDKHDYTLVCKDFAQLGTFVHVSSPVYRAVHAATPGRYTFILEATKEVPRRLMQAKKKTVGVRIPDHVVARELVAAMGEPILSSTLILPGRGEPFRQAWEIDDELGNRVDIIVDAGECPPGVTTVVDLTGDFAEIRRVGEGDVTPFE